MSKILDGKLVAAQVKAETKKRVEKLPLAPKLDVILVGEKRESEVYVRKKCEACKEVGIGSEVHRFAPTDEFPVQNLIQKLNHNSGVNGILVQLPLPKGWDTEAVFDLIDPLKDVDCLNPVNVGLLVQNRPRFLPPTPNAVHQLVIRNNLSFFKKKVVVINRSNIVGKPLSSILIQDNGEYANATVTVCHDHTPPDQLKAFCLQADVIVVAVGIPNFLTPEMVREEQIVIDVGINEVECHKNGKPCIRLVGDVHPLVQEKVRAITPVPGGVGPVTVAMLLHNTVKAYELQFDVK